MNVLLLSRSSFVDSFLPLYNAYTKKSDVKVTGVIVLGSLNTPLFSIKKRLKYPGIIKAKKYSEISIYEKYTSLDNLFFLNNAFGRFHFLSSLISIVSLLLFIIRGKYDVIHCDFAYNGWFNFLYLFKNKTVRTQHDPFPHTGEGWNENTKRTLEEANRKIIKTVILNKSQYKEFCDYNKKNPEDVLVNRLGVYDYLSIFDTEVVKEDPNCILYFGRLSKYKGLENLCKAMVIAHEQNPNLKVVIAGSGRFDFDISDYKDLPYFQIINKFLGLDELASLIKKAAVISCVYTDATQSGVMLTSFAMGKPVIASNIDTMREIVDDGQSGVLVEPDNPKALAEAVVKVLNNESLRVEMKQYIQELYTTGNRSWDNIVTKYLEFYKK